MTQDKQTMPEILHIGKDADGCFSVYENPEGTPSVEYIRADLAKAPPSGDRAKALEALRNGDMQTGVHYMTVLAALTAPQPEAVTVEDVRKGFIIWNFDTKMNDLLYHIFMHYNLSLKDCEACANTGRADAGANEPQEYFECTDCPRHKIKKA
jgi:hypothetical protein